MANDEKKRLYTRLTLRFTDLAIPDEKRTELEKAADGMADMADSFGYLDPMDEELSVIFDPRL